METTAVVVWIVKLIQMAIISVCITVVVNEVLDAIREKYTCIAVQDLFVLIMQKHVIRVWRKTIHVKLIISNAVVIWNVMMAYVLKEINLHQ